MKDMTAHANDRIEFLTVAFLNDELTNQERQELKSLLEEPENKAYFRQMYHLWYTSNQSLSGKDVEAAWQRTWNRVSRKPEKNHRHRIIPFGKMAAAVVLSFGMGLMAYHLLQTKEHVNTVVPEANKITVPLGSKSQVELPDGTIVTLNAGSRLQYHTFGSNSREVSLEGEAYFKVVKNTEVPFIVKARNVSIKALGTEFNVKAYSDEKMVQTTLVNGLVSIRKTETNRETDEIILKPKQTVTMYDADDEPVETDEHIAAVTHPSGSTEVPVLVESDVNTEVYTSWKDKRWIIESETIEELSLKLQRRYDVHIIITDEALKKYPFNGILADETLEQVLDIMKSVVPINYKIDKKTVLLSINPHQKKIFEELMK